MKELVYHQTPVQELQATFLAEAGVRLIVKREDLNHPFVSGNKWWKLKYNLREAAEQRHDTILTFGGAYSNHIYATAAAAAQLGLKSIGIIRGEEALPLNPTLTFAREKGMHLHHIPREAYRRKTDAAFLDDLRQHFGNFYMIPEGGTNDLAIRGCYAFGQSLLALDFDYVCLPAGTGGTAAGIIAAVGDKAEVLCVSVLQGDFLEADIAAMLSRNLYDINLPWRVLTSYHHGGYAKVSPELTAFIRHCREEHDLPLDPVYTAKLLWAVEQEVVKGTFRRGATILVLHTGGLQGAQGFLP
ncbi:MAG TPA: pyridoxal-phosphate dependent enzyme [Ohtaekwangia sp.]|nr:pyridoxal-phosphate dependent enzyme [Ohtaekwangia sp.]